MNCVLPPGLVTLCEMLVLQPLCGCHQPCRTIPLPVPGRGYIALAFLDVQAVLSFVSVPRWLWRLLHTDVVARGRCTALVLLLPNAFAPTCHNSRPAGEFYSLDPNCFVMGCNLEAE